MHDPITIHCHDENEEAEALECFFTMLHVQGPNVPIWTFNGLRYDLPLLMQRARALRVTHPEWEIRKYSTLRLIDLWDKLTFGGNVTNIMGQSLAAFCRRYQIDHDETVSGQHTAAHIKDGDYETVARHCADDVRGTVRLATEFLGLRGPAVCVDLETVAIDDVARFLGEPKANGSMKDPEKIAVDLAKKRQAQLDEAALDINLARIVVLGYQVVPAEACVYDESECPV